MKKILRKTHHRFILWGCVDLLTTVAALGGFSLLIAAGFRLMGPPPGLQQVGMYVWWVFCLLLISWRVGTFGLALFNSRGILQRLEKAHPEYRNELSTLIYLDSHGEEIEHFGFSPSLIEALRDEVDELPSPEWARLGLSPQTRKALLGFGAIGGIALIGFTFLAPDFTKQLVKTQLYGTPQWATETTFPIDLPDRVEVPYKQELVFSATGERDFLDIDFSGLDETQTVDLLAKKGGAEWNVIGAIRLGDAKEGPPVRIYVDQETEICFSGSSGLSSVCQLVPVYPPAVQKTEVAIESPEYARRPRRLETDSLKIEAIMSSAVGVTWSTNGPVVSSTLEILSPTQSVLASHSLAGESPQVLHHRLVLEDNTRIRLALTDRFGQKGLSKVLQMTAIADNVPEVEILSPTREVTLPPDLQVPIKMTARDDIGLSSVEIVYRVDNGMPSGGQHLRQNLADNLMGEIGGATPYLGETLLDLSLLDLWPGDQVVYWFEAYDYRGIASPGKGISPTHFVRYPSVEENLDEMASVREKSVEGLQDLLDEQKQINRQFEEIRKDLQRNRANLSDPDIKFDAQKKLADTYQREQDLQEKLEEAGQQLDQTLQRLSEDDNQALRTLHKFQRVQELMDELMTEESKKILQELQETLKQLQKEELRPEDLERTEQSLEDFEKQLDRQLSLLENLWLEQEVEALRDQAEELAERQEELKDSTMDQLSEEDQAEVEAEMAEDEVDLENPDENLEERVDEMIDRLEEALEEKKDSESQESESTENNEQESDESQESSDSESESSEQEESQSDETDSEESEAAQAEENEKEEAASSEESGEKEEGQEEDSEEGLDEKESPAQEQVADSPQDESNETKESGSQENQAMAERQEQLNQETERLIEELKRLTEEANEKQHQMADSLNQMNQGEMCESIQESQQSAQSQLEQNQMKQAAKSQSQAGQKMQQMAQSLSGCCGGSGPDMQEVLAKMREILDRSFFLSGEGEETDQSLARYKGLASWPNVDRMSRLGTEMGWYRQESARLSKEFTDIAKDNPFAEFEVVKQFDRASEQWKENTQVMEEDPPIAVSLRSHQALASVNLAIEKLIESIDETNSQSQSSSGLEGYFQGIKKMLSQQKGINEQTQQLKDKMGQKPGQRQPGGNQGEQLSAQEQMKKIAQQQAATRRQLEALEEKYQGIKNKPGSLEGAGEQMQQVEDDLEQGMMGDRVTDLQEKIVQRLLDAEKSIHNQGYKKKRRALRTDGVLVEESPPTLPDLLEGGEEEDLARLLRKDLDQVSPHWRDRIRKYYDSLLQP